MPCDAQTCTTLATFPRSWAASASGPRILFLFEQPELSTRTLFFIARLGLMLLIGPALGAGAFRSGSMDVSAPWMSLLA